MLSYQTSLAGGTRKMLLGQPCIEREADALTPEQLKQYASEVDAVCLSELKKWTSLGALKIRDRATLWTAVWSFDSNACQVEALW